jgi:hypothetical protein
MNCNSSSSNAKPIKRANFPEIYQSFQNKETYRDWFSCSCQHQRAAPLFPYKYHLDDKAFVAQPGNR